MPDQANGLFSQWVRNRRVTAVRQYLTGQILDVGCGVGYLAEFVAARSYCGVDPDEESVSAARGSYPNHRFITDYPRDELFNTIVLLAVIEHIADAAEFLAGLKKRLAPAGNIILTTPHPAFKQVLCLGAAIKLLSRHAAEEHKGFFDFKGILDAATKAGLTIVDYRRFLAGANQLFILRSR